MKLGKWFAPNSAGARVPAGAKASRGGPLLSLTGAFAARWTQRRYDRLADEGYRKNVIAYRCIQRVASAAAAIPLLLHDGQGRELVAHPLRDLLDHPNPQDSGRGLREALYAHLQIAGNAWLEAVRPDAGEAPSELWSLRPDRMKVLPGPHGLPLAYEYSAGGRAVKWPVDDLSGEADVLHLKTFHPLDDWYGQSPTEAALMSIDQHNAASSWNQALLQNSARPTGALVYAPKDGPQLLTEDQYARLKTELSEQIEGAGNAGRPLLLEGGLDWKVMSLSPAEMDWRQGRDTAAREIALAYGVPPQLIGLPDAQTYSNYREARLAFYEDTVLPLAESFCASLNNWLAPMFGDGLRLALDLDEIPALAPRREAVWSRLSAATFLSDDEKRAALGYGVRET